MNIIPPPDQRLYPFEFYSQMRRLKSVVYDERNNIWGVFRYGDVQSVLAAEKCLLFSRPMTFALWVFRAVTPNEASFSAIFLGIDNRIYTSSCCLPLAISIFFVMGFEHFKNSLNLIRWLKSFTPNLSVRRGFPVPR